MELDSVFELFSAYGDSDDVIEIRRQDWPLILERIRRDAQWDIIGVIAFAVTVIACFTMPRRKS